MVTLVIGITALLGLVVLGLGIFVVGAATPRFPSTKHRD
jgi:hypothetical protein